MAEPVLREPFAGDAAAVAALVNEHAVSFGDRCEIWGRSL